MKKISTQICICVVRFEAISAEDFLNIRLMTEAEISAITCRYLLYNTFKKASRYLRNVL